MRDFFSGTLAMAGLTVREAMRQRLWILLLVAVAVLLAGLPSLSAVDETARLKLAVSTISGVIGFVCTLLAILMIAATVRRDLDSRTGFLLFSKPLPRAAYCCGRWLGVVACLISAVAVLVVVGSFMVRMQLGYTPAVRSVQAPVAWSTVDGLGAVTPLRADQQRWLLPQTPGSAVRFHFTQLRRDNQPQELLLKAQVRGDSTGSGFDYAPVQVHGIADDGNRQALVLADDSPYGSTLAMDEPAPAGVVVLRNRSDTRKDLAADYLRVTLPGGVVADDGTLTIQLTRTTNLGMILFHRDESAVIARQGGGFTLELFKSGVVSVGRAGVLAAVAMALVTLSGVGTALLGCLTLWFGGSALGSIMESMRFTDAPSALQRFMELMAIVVPDFNRFHLAAELAGSQVSSWALVAQGWMYFGQWTLVTGVIAWIVLVRREL